jgi:hypothetical protein
MGGINGLLASSSSGDRASLSRCLSRGISPTVPTTVARHSFLPSPSFSHTCCYSGCGRMFSSMITSTDSAVGDALFALDAAVQPRVQRGEIKCLAFLDWSKACDRVMHHAFLDRLAHKGVSGKMWRLIDALFSDARPGCPLEAASPPLCLCIEEWRRGAPCPLSCMRSMLMACLSLSKPSVPTLAFVLGKNS